MVFFSDETAKDNPAVYMFKIFNTGVVALAAVMFMWNILSATINGAHDGKFLGKRYNSYWMPTRTTLGLVLIMPLMGNGWSPAQALMGWAAWAGTGIATAVAKSPQANINQNIAIAFNIAFISFQLITRSLCGGDGGFFISCTGLCSNQSHSLRAISNTAEIVVNSLITEPADTLLLLLSLIAIISNLVIC